MSAGIQGAAPEELRQLARELQQGGEALLAVRAQVGGFISSKLRWEGPDAFVFRHAWQSSYAPAIAQAASMLTDTAGTITAQARQQEETSS